jgi:hypothetical protein
MVKHAADPVTLKAKCGGFDVDWHTEMEECWLECHSSASVPLLLEARKPQTGVRVGTVDITGQSDLFPPQVLSYCTLLAEMGVGVSLRAIIGHSTPQSCMHLKSLDFPHLVG